MRLQTLILAALFPIVCNAQSAPATSEKKVSGRLTKPVAVAALPPRTMTKSPPRVMAMSARVNLPQLARQALAVHFPKSEPEPKPEVQTEAKSEPKPEEPKPEEPKPATKSQ